MDLDTLHDLLSAALTCWALDAGHECVNDGVRIDRGGETFEVTPLTGSTGFSVRTADGRPEHCASAAVMLRVVRSMLDPDYRPSRPIIGKRPPALTPASGSRQPGK